jgi:hypothetical protein
MSKDWQGWEVVSVQQPVQSKVGWCYCLAWCDQNFQPHTFYYVGEGVFTFKNESDANWFKLRWFNDNY